MQLKRYIYIKAVVAHKLIDNNKEDEKMLIGKMLINSEGRKVYFSIPQIHKRLNTAEEDLHGLTNVDEAMKLKHDINFIIYVNEASKVLKVSLLVLMMFTTSKLATIKNCHRQLQPFSHFRAPPNATSD